MTREQESYLAGFACQARVNDLYKREPETAGNRRASVLCQRLQLQTPDRLYDRAFEEGYADGALAAFGHGDTDGANVGGPDPREWYCNRFYGCEYHGDCRVRNRERRQ